MKKQHLIYLFLFLGLTACNSKKSIQPQQKDIIDAVFASGYIISEDEYLVTANTEGYLVKTWVREGDSIKPEAPLFMLSGEVQSLQLNNAQSTYVDAQQRLDANSPQIQQIKLQIAQAKLQTETDKANYQRYANLVKTQAVSQASFEKAKLQYESSQRNEEILEKNLSDLVRNLELSLKNAETQFAIQQNNAQDYVLNALKAGTVLQVFKKTGELVRKGESLAKIGSGKKLIKLYVAEEDIDKIKLGQKAVISLNTDKENRFNATISKIYPSFDAQEVSFIVEASFDQIPKNLLANTQLQANIIIAEKKNALLIPTPYLLKGDSVLLADKKKQFVKTGLSNREWTEIISGLSESQSIILPKKN